MSLSEILVILHLLWVVFMIGGFILALLGIVWWRVRRFVVFRTTHVIGIALTASVPLWAGICPVTRWEYNLSGGEPPRSFIADFAHRVLYIDVSPALITVATTVIAIASVALYFMYPPWKQRRSPP